ncbi:hypothetical protein [Gemmobacter sp.]|uniref:hypothetical protein n=1 Tax=Gemmobacter sp. TaxID=1898957 RepID=UPI002AFE4BF4|nr:hypothetical protein [Gemmobacter sp.]
MVQNDARSRDIPLWDAYNIRPIQDQLTETFDVNETGAVILLAAYDAHCSGRRVSYSRAKEFYTKRSNLGPRLTWTKVTRAVDDLAMRGWIQHSPAARGSRGWQSSFAASPQLVDTMTPLLQSFGKLEALQPTRLTILRDSDGHDLDYRITREIERRDRRTQRFNDAIVAADIRLKGATQGPFHLARPMVRIFNLDPKFRRGGRFYARGASWQNIPSPERCKLLIDGTQVTEFDFAALHPTMLYAEAGLPLPKAPYEISGWPRPIVKAAFLRLINTDSEKQAINAITSMEPMREIAQLGSTVVHKSMRLIADIKRVHEPIAAAFHSDAGARLMRRDSDIAEAVMKSTIVRMGIVTLPVHDSFIVQVSKREVLLEAMEQAAGEAGLRDIRIEETSSSDTRYRRSSKQSSRPAARVLPAFRAHVCHVYQVIRKLLTDIWGGGGWG